MTVFIFICFCGFGSPVVTVSEMHSMRSCQVAKEAVTKRIGLSDPDRVAQCLPGGAP